MDSKNPSIAILLEFDRFSYLNTIEIKKLIEWKDRQYYFFIQSCTNISRSELKKINKIKN